MKNRNCREIHTKFKLAHVLQFDGAKFEANWYEFERNTLNCGRLPGDVRGAELSALGTVAAVPARAALGMVVAIPAWAYLLT